ncbi:hypothetical protein CRE_09504 [Caenorhabditis remanei]|uniref:BTB domain-containing protein n=1 Tax=Caenorhabditis remanei TaxID=31234 RepID=E3MIY6_CAERE|nr:hypothetical protein CRE_09504 [Caenorhabditis remanei]
MARPDQQFVMSALIENVPDIKENEDYFSKEEEHFNVPWQLRYRTEETSDGEDQVSNKFSLYLKCLKTSDDIPWSVKAECELSVKSANGRTTLKKETFDFGSQVAKTSFGWPLIAWNTLKKDYIVDGMLKIEAIVSIKEMVGIEKKALKTFDETKKQYSDMVLLVEDQKFHVSKLFLASHSTYFNSLFFGNFEESKKTEITLTDVKASDFQNFLEVLHGEPGINDNTVVGVLHLTDMYDAPTAHGRCEEFLLKESMKSLKEKLFLSTKYKLANLKNNCLSKTRSIAEIRAVLPGNLEDLDHSVMATLFQKSLSHQ